MGHFHIFFEFQYDIFSLDLMILVIDIQKGIETQTAECLVIGEITKKPLIVVLNKIDIIEESLRDKTIDKMMKKVRKVLEQTTFDAEAEIVPVSAKLGLNIESLTSTIMRYLEKITIERDKQSPLIFAYDHCFAIRGSGTILSGTILRGEVSANDTIHFPMLKLDKKIKSMQMFKKPITKAVSGDRLGICVTNVDASLLERGLVTTATHKSCLQYVSAVIIKFNRVRYFKKDIKSKSKFHMSIGHETALGKVTFFSSNDNKDEFDWTSVYHYEDVLTHDEKEQQSPKSIFCLVEFENNVICHDNMLLIGSKLDADQTNKSCRIAFHGKISIMNAALNDKQSNANESFMSNLRVYKTKTKLGNVQRVVNSHELIAVNLFKKDTDRSKFIGMKCRLDTGDVGIVGDSFGLSGKVKVSFKDPLEQSTVDSLKQSKNEVKIILEFKKSVFNKAKNEMIQ